MEKIRTKRTQECGRVSRMKEAPYRTHSQRHERAHAAAETSSEYPRMEGAWTQLNNQTVKIENKMVAPELQSWWRLTSAPSAMAMGMRNDLLIAIRMRVWGKSSISRWRVAPGIAGG